MSQIQRKNLGDPDEVRPYVHGVGTLTRVGTHTIGRGVLEPGWRWTTHMGPVMGTPSCPVHHVQLLISGRFGVRMDDGEELILEPNDVADIPPGHDAWVEGDEPVVLLDIGGNIDAIGVPREHRRIVTTLLMTDIVDSTRLASELGDQAWRQRLADHNRVVRTHLARADGTRSEHDRGRIPRHVRERRSRDSRGSGHPRRRPAGLESQIRAGSTPARSSFCPVTSAASPCTPWHGSWRWPGRRRCSSRLSPSGWPRAVEWRSSPPGRIP